MSTFAKVMLGTFVVIVAPVVFAAVTQGTEGVKKLVGDAGKRVTNQFRAWSKRRALKRASHFSSEI